ncbi:MAG: hypothetical protein Q9213_004234 [Squamulea squamosa]
MSLPPRPPPQLTHPLPPRPNVPIPELPTPAPDRVPESTRWSNRLERRHVRLRHGRLQYREGSEQEWEHIDESWTSVVVDKETHREPWNVEQVYFRQGSIEVSQFHSRFDGRDPATHPELPAQCQFRVTFEDISDIFISETTVPFTTAKGQEYTEVYCAVRFKCRSLPECLPIIREEKTIFPKGENTIGTELVAEVEDEDDEGDDGAVDENANEDSDKDGDEDGIEAGKEEEEEDDEGEDEADEEDHADPATFPLAKCFNQDNVDACVGREIRLAHKKTRDVVIRFLAGQEFVHHQREDFSASLEDVAERMKNQLRAFTLVKRPTTLERTVEWELCAKANELQQKAAGFKVPGSTPFTFRIHGPADSVPAPAVVPGGKRKYGDMTEDERQATRAALVAEQEQNDEAIKEAQEAFNEAQERLKELQKQLQGAKLKGLKTAKDIQALDRASAERDSRKKPGLESKKSLQLE